jgi:hypothetical protein
MPRALLTSVVLLIVTTLLAIQGAFAESRATVPDYRYTGVVENARGAPTHYIGTGDGIALVFFDAFAQGRKSERYRACIGRPGKAPVRCWNLTAAFGLGKLTFPGTLPRAVPTGALAAHWLVAGRTVATWPFFYLR